MGAADLRVEMYRQYDADKSKLYRRNQELPHHQLVETLASAGLAGGLVFLLGWFYPVFSRRHRPGFLFFTFWVCFSVSMQFESLLERQSGMVVIAFALGLALQESKAKREADLS